VLCKLLRQSCRCSCLLRRFCPRRSVCACQRRSRRAHEASRGTSHMSCPTQQSICFACLVLMSGSDVVARGQ